MRSSADLPLPPGFDLVALGWKERTRVINMRRNPDRKVEDFDEETGKVTNSGWTGQAA